MTENFNRLTPAESERLAMLAEECAEVIQVVGKILRHGYSSTHPNGGPDNRRLLNQELGDVLGIIEIMKDANDVTDHGIKAHISHKIVRVEKYSHHQNFENFQDLETLLSP